MMSPVELTETTGLGDVDDTATRILQEERLSETMRDAFRSMNNSLVENKSDNRVDDDDNDDDSKEERDDSHSREPTVDRKKQEEVVVGYSTPKKQHIEKSKMPKTPPKIFRRSSSSGNISIATALTLDISDDEASSTSAIRNVKGGEEKDGAGSKIRQVVDIDASGSNKEHCLQSPQCKTKLIKLLGDEVVQLKNDVAYAREREDDYRWAIQTLVTERDLLKLELMQYKNEQDNDRCETKRLKEDITDLRQEIAELTMKNTMLEQQRDEYREDRQQLQQTLNRLFQSGRVTSQDGAPCASELIASIRRASGRGLKGAGQFWRRRN